MYQHYYKLGQQQHHEEAAILARLLTGLQASIKYMHEEIQITHFQITSSLNRKPQDTYYSRKGIKLLDTFGREYTGDYPCEQDEWEYTGYQVWFLQDNTLLYLERSGVGSNRAGQLCKWLATYTNITVTELLEFSTFTVILHRLKEIFNRAIYENKNKAHYLQTRTRVLEEINTLLRSTRLGAKYTKQEDIQ